MKPWNGTAATTRPVFVDLNFVATREPYACRKHESSSDRHRFPRWRRSSLGRFLEPGGYRPAMDESCRSGPASESLTCCWREPSSVREDSPCGRHLTPPAPASSDNFTGKTK